jgi:hypothetical protein
MDLAITNLCEQAREKDACDSAGRIRMLGYRRLLQAQHARGCGPRDAEFSHPLSIYQHIREHPSDPRWLQTEGVQLPAHSLLRILSLPELVTLLRAR